MRSSTGTLQTWLATKPTQVWAADLFTITLVGGTVLRWTSSDVPVTYGGNTWLAVGPQLTRSNWSVKNTIEVPTMEITLASTGTDYTGGSNIKTAIHNGLLDGAYIELDRAMGTSSSDIRGTTQPFSGRVAQVEIGAATVKITVKGLNVLLEQYMPKNRYMLGCTHTLYDAGCTLAASAFTLTNACSIGSTATRVTQYDNWRDGGGGVVTGTHILFGTMTITSGVGAGQKRTIIGGASGAFGGFVDLSYPLYIVPGPTDTLSAVFGCDKSLTTCTSRFANQQNYRGFPNIPPAEQAL